MLLRRHAYAHRPLLRALTLSALAHALLLVGAAVPLPLAPELSAGEARVQATLRMPSGAGRADAPAAAARAQPAMPVPAARSPRQERRSTPVLAALEAAPDGPRTAAVAPPASEAPAAVNAAPPQVPAGGRRDEALASAAGRRPTGRAGGGSAGDGGPGEVPADELRHYRVALASAARRFKRYPPLARERGWEGTSEVAVVLRAGLPHPPEVRLTRSSGRELLDAQAMEMVAQAARVAEVPNGLRGRDLRIELPVRFSLEDER